jgi:hypothetical protein
MKEIIPFSDERVSPMNLIRIIKSYEKKKEVVAGAGFETTSTVSLANRFA